MSKLHVTTTINGEPAEFDDYAALLARAEWERLESKLAERELELADRVGRDADRLAHHGDAARAACQVPTITSGWRTSARTCASRSIRSTVLPLKAAAPWAPAGSPPVDSSTFDR